MTFHTHEMPHVGGQPCMENAMLMAAESYSVSPYDDDFMVKGPLCCADGHCQPNTVLVCFPSAMPLAA